MAERRMFAKSIIDSDAFLDMPLSTQALYFHLSMRADDDGFTGNPKKIARMLGTGDDEFKVLFAKKFLIGFETGVIVIKHWKIHNYIQKDRYRATNYVDEKALLSTKTNNSYTMDTKCIQVGYTGKDRIGKVSLGEDSLGKDSVIVPKKTDPFINPSKDYFIKQCKEILNFKPRLNIEECHRIIEIESDNDDFNEIIPEALKKMKEIKWEFKDGTKKPSINWLLESNNFEKILNGHFDNNLSEDELFMQKLKREREEKLQNADG